MLKINFGNRRSSQEFIIFINILKFRFTKDQIENLDLNFFIDFLNISLSFLSKVTKNLHINCCIQLSLQACLFLAICNFNFSNYNLSVFNLNILLSEAPTTSWAKIAYAYKVSLMESQLKTSTSICGLLRKQSTRGWLHKFIISIHLCKFNEFKQFLFTFLTWKFPSVKMFTWIRPRVSSHPRDFLFGLIKYSKSIIIWFQYLCYSISRRYFTLCSRKYFSTPRGYSAQCTTTTTLVEDLSRQFSLLLKQSLMTWGKTENLRASCRG